MEDLTDVLNLLHDSELWEDYEIWAREHRESIESGMLNHLMDSDGDLTISDTFTLMGLVIYHSCIFLPMEITDVLVCVRSRLNSLYNNCPLEENDDLY